jgi:hypothetical protein
MSAHPLNSKELLLLYYLDGIKTDFELPGYFKYRYELDTQSAITKLIKQGLLSTEHDLDTNMKKTTVEKLKGTLKKYNLPVTGTKPILIQRLNENVPIGELETNFPDVTFRHTEIGAALVGTHDYIWYYHNINYVNVSIEEAYQENLLHPELSLNEIGYNVLSRKKEKHWKEKNYGLYRNILLGYSELCYRENKLVDSLRHLFQVSYIDLSGLRNNFNLDLIYGLEEWDKTSLYFPFEKSIAKLAPGVLNSIENICEDMEIDPFNRKSIYFETVSQLTPSISVIYC